ncbi:DUF6226 family protein [Demequina sp. NBRC 110052]|uniref:DUF6226 family protein n=1 Tax=Demequina sp. NBRC 110052 TaxID=1570341 RepID=UPI0009FC5429|nr:DUF6226 family protein [Demequina sp. NBRC 110052]
MYTRPDVAFPEYRDDAGAVIPYGLRRSLDGWPPDDAYSVTSHPERFEVMWTVARAIVDHLVATYDAVVIDGADPSVGRAQGEHLREARPSSDGEPSPVRRLEPRGPGVPLTVIESAAPGVQMLAGASLEVLAPVCACDACDDSAEELADYLEEFAFAVAAGEAWEAIDSGGVRHGLTLPGHGASGGWTRKSFSQRRELRALMRERPPFAPWPLRAA